MGGRNAAEMIAAALRDIDLSGDVGGSAQSTRRGLQLGAGGRAMAEVPVGDFTLGAGLEGFYANVPTSEGRESFSGLNFAPVELSRRKENREEQLTVDPETGDVMLNVGWPDIERGGRPPSSETWDWHNRRIK
tara:strand:- start:117 stop:515 length:399 start_codon:yes stop_codon:yes gene_type:complete